MGTDPEVNQVEVMGGFMDEQSAAVPLVPVPAPEVVCAVAGIQRPFEVNRGHLADGVIHDQFPDLGMMGA